MSPSLRTSVRRVLFAAGVVAAGSVVAEPQSTASSTEIAEVVIVTGSYIRGTAEDAALPVDVISTEELEKQGAPSAIDMLKSLTVMNGIIGESNRFTSGRGQASQGSASINLRGFGAARTLVLLNGKRLASDDANLIPSNAIARVEILKDGGATTYGSDAIAGVVNYITKERVDGLDLSADYRYIPDSDGDFNVGLAWGTSGERSDFFVSANYFHRSPLLASDRDWANSSFDKNPQGGWSTGSNPGSFLFRVPVASGPPFGFSEQRADPGCELFGGTVVEGVRGSLRNPDGTQCQTQFTQWDNLVEEQNTYQTFAQYNFDISDSTRLHVEAVYGKTDVPHAGATPSGTTTRRITSTVLPPGAFGLSTDNGLSSPARTSFFYVPLSNPGFTGAYAPGAGYVPADATAGYIQLNQWRPFLATGNPRYDSGMQRYQFERENARIAADLTGEIGSVSWLTSASYGIAKRERREADISTGRMQLALRGLGGEGCDYLTGTPGVGACQYFNPFSNALAGTRDGAANPDFNGTANSAEMVRWLEDDMVSNNEDRVAELNVVFSGDLGLSLPGGEIGWAAGGQYRHGWTESRYGNSSDRAANPCPDTPVTGSTTCSPLGESPYNFLATYNESDLDRGVNAAFTEFSLPIFDSLNAQVAARFEDYGNKGGSSFDPKLSMKWQVLDQLAFRGSVGTTFRAPSQGSLIPDEGIGFTSIFGSNRPVATVGNPDLEPEESFQWSVGAIANIGNFRAMVDFWRFDIDKILTVQPSAGLLALVFPNGATGANNCATVDPAFLAAHFQFSNDACAANNILKVTRSQINGAGLRNDGVDITMDYTFDYVLGGSLVAGISGTWIHKYETESLRIDGVLFEQGFDGVGLLNQGTSLYALPEWRVQGYLDYSFGSQNLRWTANFVDQYRDQRDLFDDGHPQGQVIDSNIQHNLTYRSELPWQTTLLATIENITDEDPSFARLELNYDPLTGYPLGRTFKIGLRKSF